jgi:hypothetical protein
VKRRREENARSRRHLHRRVAARFEGRRGPLRDTSAVAEAVADYEDQNSPLALIARRLQATAPEEWPSG